MTVRISFVAFGTLSLGVFTAACAVAAGPTGPTPARALPATSATLADPTTPAMSWLRLSPEQGSPGSTVSLDVACLDDLGPVSSPVLDIGQLTGNPEGHQPWNRFGAATVHPNATSGPYRVSVTCGAGELSAIFTVVPGPPR